jgi:hypothetical protein
MFDIALGLPLAFRPSDSLLTLSRVAAATLLVVVVVATNLTHPRHVVR